MKHLLLTTIAAVLLVGCGESQQSTPQAEPVAEVPVQPSPPPAEAKPVAETTKPTTPPKAVTVNKGADPARGIKPEPPTAKVPDISIHEAAKDGNIKAVKQHLAAGTDVNAKDKGGGTPLHSAAFEGHKEIVELLTAKGADVNAKIAILGTPLDWAIRRKHPETADLLRKHGGKTGEELKAEGK
jgi:outer membrane biosynthesis protein TonB